MIILKIKFPPIYKKIKNNELSYEELISRQELSAIFKSKEEEESLIDFFTKWLKFLLITEEQFNNLDEKDEIRDFSKSLFKYRIKRQKIITFFCDSLDSFHLATDR